MKRNSKRTILGALAIALVFALAALAIAGCGGETTTTTAAPTDTTAAPTDTTAAPTDTTAAPTDTTGGAAGASGAIAVTGMVDNPMTITVETLQGMNPEKITVEHPKKGSVEYTGVRFSAVIEALKVQAGATTVAITASDGYAAEAPLADIAASADSLLAIGDDGTISSAFPGLDGQTWVKDIVSMEFK